MEDVLFSGGWEGVAGGDAPLLDGAALATYFLVTELSKNPDGYRGSAFMHKVRCTVQRLRTRPPAPGWLGRSRQR